MYASHFNHVVRFSDRRDDFGCFNHEKQPEIKYFPMAKSQMA